MECERKRNVPAVNDSVYLECCQRATRAGLLPRSRLFGRQLEQWVSLPGAISLNTSAAGTRLTLYSLPNVLCAWMANFSDRTPLAELALPAAHDAGSAATEGWLSALLRTQAFPMLVQMLLGVRAFDIRPMRDLAASRARARNSQPETARSSRKTLSEPTDMWTHHEKRKGESLAHFATAARLFLRAFPSETLIVYVSHEVRCSRQEACAAIEEHLNPDVGMLFVDGNTTLGESRGRLVVLKNLHWNIPPPPFLHDGFERWRDLLTVHLLNVRMRPHEFERFPCALTPRLGLWLPHTPRELALRDGLPGLCSWLTSETAPTSGLFEADWFGNSTQVARLIGRIVLLNERAARGSISSLNKFVQGNSAD